jgi:hypothetical protein
MRPDFGSVAVSSPVVERLLPLTAARYRPTNCWLTHSHAARRTRPGSAGASTEPFGNLAHHWAALSQGEALQ